MKQVTANNNNATYYMIGKVIGMSDTVLVQPKGTNGDAMMFCIPHMNAYPIQGQCQECQNAVLDLPVEANVTTCYTPEFER